jgi:hypothetical protein
MDVLTFETCCAVKWWNNKASDIKLVYLYSSANNISDRFTYFIFEYFHKSSWQFPRSMVVMNHEPFKHNEPRKLLHGVFCLFKSACLLRLLWRLIVRNSEGATMLSVLWSALDFVLCHLNADRTLASCFCKNSLGVIIPSALQSAKWPANQSDVTRKNVYRAYIIILVHVTVVWVNEFVLACVLREDCTSRRIVSLKITS